MDSKEELQKKISEIEAQMNDPDFWNDKAKAQTMIREYQELKDTLEGGGKYDRAHTILSIYAGAGGDDAEDFAAMLYRMYSKFATKEGWPQKILHEHQNDHGGYRSITVELQGKGSYKKLLGEYGVHRLVRISPFNANAKRHTSFALVEILPAIDKPTLSVPDDEFEITFQRSSGPGGQNVNKRETAVRVVHRKTGISAHVDSERMQGSNKEKAIAIVTAKLERLLEAQHKKEVADLSIAPGGIEWGSQIRSYVLHPYKLVKDHRTGVEVHQAEDVLENGAIEPFLEKQGSL